MVVEVTLGENHHIVSHGLMRQFSIAHLVTWKKGLNLYQVEVDTTSLSHRNFKLTTNLYLV